MTAAISDLMIEKDLAVSLEPIDYELSLFRLVRRACREKNGRVKSWGREACVLLAPPGFHATIFSSQFLFASRKTDKAKEGLLVVYRAEKSSDNRDVGVFDKLRS